MLAVRCLVCVHLFSLFAMQYTESMDAPWRNVHHLNVSRIRAYVIVDIQANAFIASYGAYCGKFGCCRFR